MFSKASLGLLLPLLLLFQCSGNATAPEEKIEMQINQTGSQILTANNQFGWKLFSRLVGQEEEQNVFISPLSISLALGMTLNGAAGETRQAMETTLELQGLSPTEINESYRQIINLLLKQDPKVILHIANSIWYRQQFKIKPEFIDLNKKYFQALVRGLDFSDPAAADIINKWVNEQTRGKITQIIDRLRAEDFMLLINAIYFKGIWTYQFNPKLTREKPFHLYDGSETTCQMMQLEQKLPYLETADFQMVELPYGGQHFSAVVILPRPEKKLPELLPNWDAEQLQQWIQQLHPTQGTLLLPKFELRYQKSLREVLSQLGMAVAFDRGRADFSAMYEGPEKLFLSDVLHKTYLKVDEEGTEAAAVTGVIVGITSVGHEKRFFMQVDRPFLFLIRDRNTGTILFLGQILQPEWSGS